jgi:hypothetical protein
MAFIKLNRQLELNDGERRRNIEVDESKVTEQDHWIVFSYESHTYKIPRDHVSFVRYAEEVEEDQDIEEDTEILIT